MNILDELNKIYNEEGVTTASTFKMIKAITNQHPKKIADIYMYICVLKRDDCIWRKFCEGKPELDENSFRNDMLRHLYGEKKTIAMKLLEWQ